MVLAESLDLIDLSPFTLSIYNLLLCMKLNSK